MHDALQKKDAPATGRVPPERSTNSPARHIGWPIGRDTWHKSSGRQPPFLARENVAFLQG